MASLGLWFYHRHRPTCKFNVDDREFLFTAGCGLLPKDNQLGLRFKASAGSRIGSRCKGWVHQFRRSSGTAKFGCDPGLSLAMGFAHHCSSDEPVFRCRPSDVRPTLGSFRAWWFPLSKPHSIVRSSLRSIVQHVILMGPANNLVFLLFQVFVLPGD